MPLSVDTGHNLAGLREEVKMLKQHLKEREDNDVGMNAAKRKAAEMEELVASTRATWELKLFSEKRDFESSRKDSVDRIARYEKKIAENQKRISELEAIALKKVSASATPETLEAVLQRLGLTAYHQALDDEELDVPLLRSMGRDLLISNMTSLGLTEVEATRLASELCAS